MAMNKFRILTTDGEWVYSQVNVLEDRIVCPILNAQGAQFLKPNLEFRPETLSQFVERLDHTNKWMYAGDILSDCGKRKGHLIWVPSESSFMVVSGKNFEESQMYMSLNTLLELRSEVKIIGNIHENPELLEEKK